MKCQGVLWLILLHRIYNEQGILLFLTLQLCLRKTWEKSRKMSLKMNVLIASLVLLAVSLNHVNTADVGISGGATGSEGGPGDVGISGGATGSAGGSGGATGSEGGPGDVGTSGGVTGSAGGSGGATGEGKVTNYSSGLFSGLLQIGGGLVEAVLGGLGGQESKSEADVGDKESKSEVNQTKTDLK